MDWSGVSSHAMLCHVISPSLLPYFLSPPSSDGPVFRARGQQPLLSVPSTSVHRSRVSRKRVEDLPAGKRHAYGGWNSLTLWAVKHKKVLGYLLFQSSAIHVWPVFKSFQGEFCRSHPPAAGPHFIWIHRYYARCSRRNTPSVQGRHRIGPYVRCKDPYVCDSDNDDYRRGSRLRHLSFSPMPDVNLAILTASEN